MYRTFTPHARGSTAFFFALRIRNSVYPACAGIDRRIPLLAQRVLSLPRMRGDRPTRHANKILFTAFTPHARGSTCQNCKYPPPPRVYPACAGIDPLPLTFSRRPASLPRMRGDRPCKESCNTIGNWVYPACAGIDLFWSPSSCAFSCLPRMRGDRPFGTS